MASASFGNCERCQSGDLADSVTAVQNLAAHSTQSQARKSPPLPGPAHEPQGRVRYSVRAGAWELWGRRARSDAPYLHKLVQGFNARNFVSGKSLLHPMEERECSR